MKHASSAYPFRSLLLSLVAVLALLASGCEKSEPPVVTVDVEKILTDSKAAKAAKDHLSKVQAILQKGLEDYRKEIEKSPEDQRRNELIQGLNVLNRQLTTERLAAGKVVENHMVAQVENWLKSHPNTVVLPRSAALGSTAPDITTAIVTAMDAGEVTFADLPKVTIRPREEAATEKGDAAGTKEKAAEKAPASGKAAKK